MLWNAKVRCVNEKPVCSIIQPLHFFKDDICDRDILTNRRLLDLLFCLRRKRFLDCIRLDSDCISQHPGNVLHNERLWLEIPDVPKEIEIQNVSIVFVNGAIFKRA